jgi:precorrin-6A synthase
MSVVGIGTGNPEHITVQAISTLNDVDVVFMMDKGDAARELLEFRREICERYITNPSCRIVTAADPERPRGPAAGGRAAADWRTRRAEIYEQLIAGELGGHGHGAFLAWGDPAMYDGTVDVLRQVLARETVSFELRVIPGISSIQALAAQHKISLTRAGRPLHITTGRLIGQGFPGNADDVVVMLDAYCAFTEMDEDLDIYWGAGISSAGEALISGRVADVGQQIAAARAAFRSRHGWVMDSYLLRRPDSPSRRGYPVL